MSTQDSGGKLRSVIEKRVLKGLKQFKYLQYLYDVSDFATEILSNVCLTSRPREWKTGNSWLVILIVFKPQTLDYLLGSNSASLGIFSCHEGFNLEGKDTIGCNLFGEWESAPPVCKRIKY